VENRARAPRQEGRQKNPSRAPLPHIDFIKQIRAGVLQASQFPVSLRDQHGVFTKPPAW
jgi:hypothetical protein